MSEESIVTLIGMALTAGVLAPIIGWLNRRLGGDKDRPAPVTTADAEATHAHQSQQLVLASLNGLAAALKQEQERTTCLEGQLGTERTERARLGRIVEELRAARDQDGAMIRTLTTWARDVHTRWPALRLSETPPPLPENIQPPERPGVS